MTGTAVKTNGEGRVCKEYLNLTRSLETVDPFRMIVIRPRKVPIQLLTAEERSRRISDGMRDGRQSRMGSR